MKTYIVLLRGVMPVGKNKVPMAQLRDVLGKAGFLNVRTWIASGNALVESDMPAKEIETTVRNLIKEHIGPDLPIVVRTAKQLQRVLDENPFQKKNSSDIFFVSFENQPSPKFVKELLAENFGDEKLAINKHAGYLFIPGFAGRSKLTNNLLEKRLKVSATTRNFNTIHKLIALGSKP